MKTLPSYRRSITLLAILALTLGACKQESKSSDAATSTTEDETASVATLPVASGVAGSYASDSYAQRGDGADWVGVNVRDAGEGHIRVSVRSRADKKRPTCTLDADAFRTDAGAYQAVLDGNRVDFTFEGDMLTIAPAAGGDPSGLYFYCSGGATVAGSYTKISGDLEASQVDKTTYMKYLRLQEIGFNVSATIEDGTQVLTIRSMGLPVSDPDPIIMDVSGEITGAEIEDLNSDGYPEVVVFSSDNGKGNVQGISVNGGKSMSMFYFPPLADTSGYNGGDEFALVETYVVQRFPIGDGKMRQISYELVDGEASRVFQVKDVTEF